MRKVFVGKIFSLDSNVWRENHPCIKAIKQIGEQENVRVGCSENIIIEMIAPDGNIRLGSSLLERVLKNTDVWLNDSMDIARAIKSFAGFKWNSGFTARAFNQDKTKRNVRHALDLSTYEKNKLFLTRQNNKSKIKNEILEARKFLREKHKQAIPHKDILTTMLNSTDYLQENGKENLTYIIPALLQPYSLITEEMEFVITNINSFPGLKLAATHFIYNHIRQIFETLDDVSYVPDMLALMPIDADTIFVTKDRDILKSKELIDERNHVLSPDELLSGLV